jgi:diguanylate cyclase (GGDEF)-like protein
VARARREESKVAVIFIDLDGFKPINDTQGHETGDWLLKAVAQRLSECLREYDTAARLGGDEFVVLLPSLTHSEDAAQIAERIRATLALPFFTNDKKQLEISASLGVSIFPDHAESARDLLQASDEAMYLAKKSGRNQVVHSHRLATPPPTPVAVADTLQPTPRSDHAARHEDARRANEPVAAGTIRRSPCERANDSSILVAEVLNVVIVDTIHGHVVGEDRDYFLFLKGATAL